MSQRNPLGGKVNRFGGSSEPTHDDVNTHFVVPGLAEAEGQRVVARPTAIMDIWPDLRQPRRVFPAAVRGNWAGNPMEIPGLLKKWEVLVGRHLRDGERLDAAAVLRGDDFIDLDTDGADAVVQAYVSLLELAISIQRDGLINPITVYEDGGRINVLTGERRLTAYHMLRLYVDEAAWSRIPAQRVAYSVRQQVQENTARRDLNAVGLARCYALICMDIASREKGVVFQPYHALVADTPHGASDRGYYAQISGTPYGYAGEVMAALNVTNRSALSRYQDVLSLPDEAWVQADMNDWTIRQCIEFVKPPKPPAPNVAQVQHFDSPPPPAPSARMGAADEGNGGRWRQLGDQGRGMAARFAGGVQDNPSIPSGAGRDERTQPPASPTPRADDVEAELPNYLLIDDAEIEEAIAAILQMLRHTSDTEFAVSVLEAVSASSTSSVLSWAQNAGSYEEFIRELDVTKHQMQIAIEDAWGRVIQALNIVADEGAVLGAEYLNWDVPDVE